MKKQLTKVLLVSAIAAGNYSVYAGGNLKTRVQTPLDETLVESRYVDIKWDKRCLPNHYILDSSLPNAGTENEIDIETLRQDMQASMDVWNNIKTSYVEMNVKEVRDIEGATNGLDFVHTITFEPELGTGGVLAFSPSVSLIGDFEFVAGLDIDGDGDSDVFNPEETGMDVCFDADNDGDIEFPAGFYQAGTIIDNDVVFNSAVLWGTGEPADNDGRADIRAVATHELGHSIGLSHSTINQIAADNADGATMFPSISTRDALAELDTRSLSEDEIAFASLFYPEGSDSSGPAALQEGDIAFSEAYGVIEGNVGRDLAAGGPVSGGVVTAFRASDNASLISAYSEGLSFVVDSETSDFTISVDGTYRLPVPKGLYNLRLSGLDGTPVTGGQVNAPVGIGSSLTDLDFEKEFYSGFGESSTEVLDYPAAIFALPGQVKNGIDFAINENVRLGNLEPVSGVGFNVPAGTRYAQRFDRDTILELLDSGKLLKLARFFTTAPDASVVPQFASAMLTLGTTNEDGTYTLDIDGPLAKESPFIALTQDASEFRFDNPYMVSFFAQFLLANDEQKELFLVLEIPDLETFPGPTGLPSFIGFNDGESEGRSYFSFLGDIFEPTTLNFAFELEAI